MKTIKIDRQSETPSRIECVGAVRFYRLLFWRDDLQMYVPAFPGADRRRRPAPGTRDQDVFILIHAKALASLFRERGWIVILQPTCIPIPRIDNLKASLRALNYQYV